jgi:hypothetical protein
MEYPRWGVDGRRITLVSRPIASGPQRTGICAERTPGHGLANAIIFAVSGRTAATTRTTEAVAWGPGVTRSSTAANTKATT